jgi:anti-sigma regulatory factor (Ser/Thr protein kinase)
MEAFDKGAASYVPKTHLNTDLAETVSRLLALAPRHPLLTPLKTGKNEINCKLENDLHLLAGFTQELRQTITERGMLNESESLRFATAVDEALMNAYFHGNLEIDSKLREDEGNAYHDLALQRRRVPPYCDRRIHVHAKIEPNQLSVTVRDEGAGFDYRNLPDPTEPAYLDRPHGRGMLLMKAFSDDVHFNESGNEVTLTKRTA